MFEESSIRRLNNLEEIRGLRYRYADEANIVDRSSPGLFAFTADAQSTPIWLSNLYSDEYARTRKAGVSKSVRVRMAFADPVFFAGYSDHLEPG